MVSMGERTTLEDIKLLLKQYQVDADFVPTKGPKHATELARESVKQKYKTVLAVGGDGTVAETANGLIGTDTTLGIVPMGSFMNIARMLSIPTELEKAIQIIKIGRTRKIDVGTITKLEGEKLSTPFYYMETAGVGLEAAVHKEFRAFEDGNIPSLFKAIKTFVNFYANTVTIKTDEKTFETRATLISIANGPYSGAALHLAPAAKLNDHKLTITLYPMNKRELIRYFLRMKFTGKTDKRRITTIQTKAAQIFAKQDLAVHADASLFGTTPAEFRIVPNALQVICGFPATEEDASLVSRTILDP